MMTQTENLAEQTLMKSLTESTSKLSISQRPLVGNRIKQEGVSVSDYLKKLYAIKSSIIDNDLARFEEIIKDVECPTSVYSRTNDVQRSQIQLIVADLLHDSVSMAKRDGFIYGLSKVFDMNERNKLGFIPLHLAVGRGKLQIANMLVRSGSDVNLQNDLGRSPLHIAVNKGFCEVAGFLIAHGADLDLTDRDLWTPLHWAARNHHLDLLRLLIRSGARLDPLSNKGLSPLDMSLAVAPSPDRQWHPMTAWHLVVYGASHLSPCSVRHWLNEVLKKKYQTSECSEFRSVNSQLFVLLAKAALIDNELLTEAADLLASDDLEEARRVAEVPNALTQLCRTKVRQLLRAGAVGRSFVENAAKLNIPTALRQFVLLKT